MTSVQFPGLAGVLPGRRPLRAERLGPRGVEPRDAKQPHWQLACVFPCGTLGYFGGSGTFLWIDGEARARLRRPHRPRVRHVGARGVAADLRCDPRGGGVNVAVVGAGRMGLAAARAIAQRGHEVAVYEQFELGPPEPLEPRRVADLPAVLHRGVLDPLSRRGRTSCGASSSGNRKDVARPRGPRVEVQPDPQAARRRPRGRPRAVRGALARRGARALRLRYDDVDA